MKVKIETAKAAALYGAQVGDFRRLEGRDAAPLIASGDVSEVTDEPRTTELSDLTVDQLKALAADRSIDLGDATTKADIIAAIELAGEAN